MRKILIVFVTLTLTSILTTTSCFKKSSNIKEWAVTIDTTIHKLLDSTFFSDVRSISFDDKICFTDYKNSQLIQLDSNLNLTMIVGKKGEGPGEFLGASHFVVANDTTIIYNDFKRSFEYYVQNTYIGTTYMPKGYIYMSTNKFAYLNNYLYFSSPTATNPAVAFNVANNTVLEFGKLIEFDSPIKQRIRNDRHIIIHGENIILVSDNVPLIERYDLQGNYIDGFNYGEIQMVKERINMENNQAMSENSYHVLVSDVSICGNNIYLLILTNKYNQLQSNTVLEIAINKDFSVNGYFILLDNWYSKLSVSGDQIVAYNAHEGLLKKYKIHRNKYNIIKTTE